MPAEIKEKLTAESALPGGFHYLLLGHLSNALLESVPEEQAAITVRGDLTVVITLDGKEVASSHYHNLQSQHTGSFPLPSSAVAH